MAIKLAVVIPENITVVNFIYNFIQRPSLRVITHRLTKLLGIISVGFDVRDQLHSSFFYSLDTGEKWEYNETVYHLFIEFKKAYDSVKMEVICNTPLQSTYLFLLKCV
jgi:hypothetical protein